MTYGAPALLRYVCVCVCVCARGCVRGALIGLVAAVFEPGSRAEGKEQAAGSRLLFRHVAAVRDCGP